MIKDLFKIPIYETELSLNLEKIKKYCISKQIEDSGINCSNEGGWHSSYLDFGEKQIFDLLESLCYHGSFFSESIGLEKKIGINNLWININKFGDYNKSHKHAGALFSGVYYVQVPKDCGNIFFEHPSYDMIGYDWKNEIINSYNQYTSHDWWIKAEPNKLLIFPSWLKHRVESSKNPSEKRISISFNLV